MKEKNYTPDFFIIPSVVMLEKTLRPLDSKVYAMVYWFEQMSQGECTASNKTIAKSIGASADGVSKAISRLKDAGFLVGEYDDKGERGSLNTTVRFVNPSSNELPPSSKWTTTPSSNELQNKKNIKEKEYSGSELQHIQATWQEYLKFFISEQGVDFTPTVMEHASKRYRLTPKRIAAIKRRLDDAGFTMLKAAIQGYGRADWSNGNNDRHWTADLADFICRSYENVERGARLYQDQQSKNDDAWAKL